MRVILTILAILYVLFPFDLFPDVVVGWGWLDDLLALYLLWRYVFGGSFTGKSYRYATGSRPRSGPEEESEGAQRSAAQFDPYSVLGISRNAGPEEIRSSYRRLAARYHPDKVAHLGEEFRILAEKRFKEIQQAYQQLTGK